MLMQVLLYIHRVFWRKASVIFRVSSFVVVSLPVMIPAALGFLGMSWPTGWFPWWLRLVLVIILGLGVLLWAVAAHAHRIEEDTRPRLRIGLGTGDPYEMTRHSEDGKITERRVRVCVENVGAERLDNCPRITRRNG
jgi:protein-S-isoprenylcysteine O-methyltransferase Ste14